MGVAASKEHPSELRSRHHHNGSFSPGYRQQQQTAGGAYCEHRQHRRQHSGPGFLSKKVFADKPASWRTEPRVVLANQSAYRVSYWVAQEDKKKTSTAQHQQQIVTSISLQLNVGRGKGTDAAGGFSKDAKATTTTTTTTTTGESSSSSSVKLEEEDDVYFLTRDHRMGPKGNTQATKVAFPVDCQDMRVYAFFELDGQWQLYEDKVYSIGLFKKVFTLISQDGNITPHIGEAGSDTAIIPDTAL